jgi:hypothetical protein
MQPKLERMLTLVLAQRTPLNAAFWTKGLETEVERSRELPTRSEEAMVVVRQKKVNSRK